MGNRDAYRYSPDPAIHAASAEDTAVETQETVHSLGVNGVAVSDVTPQAPVVDHESTFTITTHHFATILRG